MGWPDLHEAALVRGDGPRVHRRAADGAPRVVDEAPARAACGELFVLKCISIGGKLRTCTVHCVHFYQ